RRVSSACDAHGGVRKSVRGVREKTALSVSIDGVAPGPRRVRKNTLIGLFRLIERRHSRRPHRFPVNQKTIELGRFSEPSLRPTRASRHGRIYSLVPEDPSTTRRFTRRRERTPTPPGETPRRRAPLPTALRLARPRARPARVRFNTD